jgi:uncharacterized protein YndB with AHSA1/START domain
MTPEHTLEMSRVFDASRDDVFRAWTDPAELASWWGPGEFTCPEANVDLRPGGNYRLVMQPTQGDAMVLIGTYREVQPPERLVYTWKWESGWPDPTELVVTVEFRDLGEKTEVVLKQEGMTSEDGVGMQRWGWDGGLDKLERHLAGSRAGEL